MTTTGDWMLDPPDDPYTPECLDCGEFMAWDIDGDEGGPSLVTWCEVCDE